MKPRIKLERIEADRRDRGRIAWVLMVVGLVVIAWVSNGV